MWYIAAVEGFAIGLDIAAAAAMQAHLRALDHDVTTTATTMTLVGADTTVPYWYTPSRESEPPLPTWTSCMDMDMYLHGHVDEDRPSWTLGTQRGGQSEHVCHHSETRHDNARLRNVITVLRR